MRSRLLSLLILIVSALLVNGVKRRNAKKSEISNQEVNHQDCPVENTYDPTKNRQADPSCHISHAEPHVDYEREWRENQQKFLARQLNLAKWLNGITVALGLIGFLSLVFLYIQADAARKAAEIALAQLHISHRPWVGISGVVIPSSFIVSEDTQIPITYTFKNVGPSIANKVRKLEMIVFGNYIEAAKTEPSLCKFNPPNIGFADLILPGESKSQTTQYQNRSPKIDLDNTGMTQMWIVGCIFYYDQLNKLHRTPFFYVLALDKGGSTFKPTDKIKGSLIAFPTSTPAD
jgi:hypothetical protein